MKKVLYGKEFIVEDISELGVKDLAFTAQEADKLIEHLKEKQVLIFGGDLILIEQGKMKYSYENWYSNSPNYLDTYNIARKFLDMYKNVYANQNYLIIVVFKLN